MKRPFTVDEIARSFVTAFLKTAEKEQTLRQIIRTAHALAENDRTIHTDALKPENIIQACKTLSQWNQIVLVSPDTYCHPLFAPKFRTLDDTWLS